MESTCIRHTELPHTSKLFADFLYDFERVSRFYAYDPHDPESFHTAAAAMNYPEERRAALISALREQNGPSASLEFLARPGTFAVVTGQQVGLFSGPCYTIYKALTAARLARRLTESGIPAVPVFWLATEDHDFEEVNHCWVFNAANEPVRLEIPSMNAERRPVGEIPIDQAPVDALRDALRDLPFAEETVSMVAEAYAPRETFGSAFSKLLARILPSQGLLLFDPMHPASRKLGAPLVSRAVTAAPELTRRVLERDDKLVKAGYHVQVHVEPQTSFVFLLENGRRIGLVRNGDVYTANGRRFTAEELAERGESLSPNALLRPVVQDWMLPTVAYVGGPAELAYLAQTQVLYRELLGHSPVAVPRQSATLLDVRAAKLMDDYGLVLTDFFHGEDAVREKMARKLVPPELQRTLGETRVRAAELLDQLHGPLTSFDRTLGDTFAKSRRKIEYQLAKTERKTAREALRRDKRASADAAYVCGLVFPHKHPQERFYSIIPFLARHGVDLMGRLSNEMQRDCFGHRVIVV